MRKIFLSFLAISTSLFAFSYDWDGIEIPADAEGGTWELQENLSDDFNYSFNSSTLSNFGTGNKWYNFYHNSWDGPGGTAWKHSQVSVDGSDLVITVGSAGYNKNGFKAVKSGCVTSNNKVSYPAYVESSLSVANITLASCFWLLSPDDTQEIDIIENYGATEWFGSYTHISHHSFIRNPFTDYQPKDKESWFPISGISNWGEYCWNDGDRIYMRMGVYWKSPNHFEYYINGELVRVIYYNAIATKYNGMWRYSYYDSMTGQFPTAVNGYSKTVRYHTAAVGEDFDIDMLEAASTNSKCINVIDPGNFQNGTGFTKDLDIIINMESQDWLAADYTPSDADLANSAKNQMKVDWVRVYKPVSDGSGNTGGNTGGGTATGQSVTIEAENFTSTGGSGSSFENGTDGVTKNSTDISYVNLTDWVEYTVNIPENGDYQVKFNVNGPNSDVKIYINGALKTTATNIGTGDNTYSGYSESTASETLTSLTAGSQTIKFEFSVTGGWAANIDYIILTEIVAAPTKSAKAATYSGACNGSGSIHDDGTNSTIDNESNIINIYPNPTSGILYIDTESDIESNIEIYNAVGAKIYETLLTNYIDLSSLSKGIYLIKVGENIQRLVIE